MSSRREVLIRILALLQTKTLIKPKKSHIKMLKTALFDCAINEKCCSVDGGRGICPLFSSPPRGIWQLKSPHPREFAIQGKKNDNARGSARGGPGRRWNWLMHKEEVEQDLGWMRNWMRADLCIQYDFCLVPSSSWKIINQSCLPKSSSSNVYLL